MLSSSFCPGQTIAGDGGVIKTIQTEGQGWQNPKDADEVVITYTARVRPTPAAGAKPQSAADAGLPVVASSPDGGAVFDIRDAPCKGLAAALKSMKLKESVELLLSPECESQIYCPSVCAFSAQLVTGGSMGVLASSCCSSGHVCTATHHHRCASLCHDLPQH